MKYLEYVVYAVAIDSVLFLSSGVFTNWSAARTDAIVVFPLCLWTARLVVAIRTGRISRRMPMLDGGPTMSGVFWSFRPEIYVREPGFDYFKGYVFKESLCCLLLWAMYLSIIVVRVLDDGGKVQM